MDDMEKGATIIDRVPTPFAATIDEMAMVSKFKNTGLTFEKFTDGMLRFATSSSEASRIDIVFDVRHESFIKNAERGTCEIGKVEFKKIIGGQHIKQCRAFFQSDNNMTELVRFLAKR